MDAHCAGIGCIPASYRRSKVEGRSQALMIAKSAFAEVRRARSRVAAKNFLEFKPLESTVEGED